MRSKWYAKPDDLIGGWCVMDVDASPGEADHPEIAGFVSEEVARHIADLHNKWLFGQQFISASRMQKLEELRELMEELTAEFGDLTEEEVAQARKVWPPDPEFKDATIMELVPRESSSSVSALHILGALNHDDLRFERAVLTSEPRWKVIHLPSGRVGRGGSEVSAMMNLAETWDEQRR